MHDALLKHLRQTRAAFYAGMRGVTDDDMAAAARRVLEVRQVRERATGRPATAKVTKEAVARLLRSGLG